MVITNKLKNFYLTDKDFTFYPKHLYGKREIESVTEELIIIFSARGLFKSRQEDLISRKGSKIKQCHVFDIPDDFNML